MWCQQAVDQPGDPNTLSFLQTCPTGPHTFLSIPQEVAMGGDMAGPVGCSVFWGLKPPSAEAISATPPLCRVTPMATHGEGTAAISPLTVTMERCQDLIPE